MTNLSLLVLLLCAQYALASYLFVGGYTSKVSVYTISESTGALGFVKNVSSNSVTWLGWLPSANRVYGANENDNKLTSYTLDSTTGNLNVLNQVPSGGSGPVYVSVHGSGRFVMSAHYGSGDVVVFQVNADGSLGSVVASAKAGQLAHQVLIVGNYVFVPCKGSDYIAQYVFNPTTHALTPNPVAATLSLATGQGPRHLAFHPRLPYAYVISELGNTVSHLSYNSQQGTFGFIRQYSSLFPDFHGQNTGAEVAVSLDGRFLYASNRGNNSIAIFAINQNTGTLNLFALEQGQHQINTPRSFSLSPSGKVMVVANQGGKSINVFTVDTTTGLLTLRKTVSGFDQPAFVGIYATPPTPAPAPTPPTSSPSPTRKPSSTRNVKPTL